MRGTTADRLAENEPTPEGAAWLSGEDCCRQRPTGVKLGENWCWGVGKYRQVLREARHPDRKGVLWLFRDRVKNTRTNVERNRITGGGGGLQYQHMDIRLLSSVTVYMSSFQQNSNEKRAVKSTYPSLMGSGTKNSSDRGKGQHRTGLKRALSTFPGKLLGSYYQRSQQ